jgi:hypothetical protein
MFREVTSLTSRRFPPFNRCCEKKQQALFAMQVGQ